MYFNPSHQFYVITTTALSNQAQGAGQYISIVWFVSVLY